MNQIEKFKETVSKGGFYKSGHPIKTYIKYLEESNSIEVLTKKISDHSIKGGYIPLFADKMAICLYNSKNYILS